MKRNFIFLFMMCAAIAYGASANGTWNGHYYTVEDFEDSAIGTAFSTNNASLTAVVAESPVTSTEKALYFSGSDNSMYATFSVTLPSSQVLSDFDSIIVDLYIESASYKNMELWVDGTKVHSVGNLINGTNINLANQRFAFSAFNQSGASTVVSAAGNTVVIGIGSSRMNGTTFYIDNIRLYGTQAAATNAYTVTFDAGSGTCATASLTEAAEDAGVALPMATASTKCTVAGWNFYGWAAATCTETTEAPTITSGATYYPEANCTLYAVYTDGTNYNSNPACTVSLNGTVADGWLMVEDFEGYAVDAAVPYENIWGGSNTSGSAVATANPTISDEMVAHITGGNYTGVLALSVTLPAGKTLANYSQVKFNLYRNSADGNYKKMMVKAGNDTIYEDTDYVQQAAATTWTTKTYAISDAVAAGNTFTFYIGIETDAANYYIDEVQLKERLVSHTSANGTVTDSWLMVEDFEGFSIADALSVKKIWGSAAADGNTATIVADPIDDMNYAVHVLVSDGGYNDIFAMNVTLPTGKTLVNYDQIKFDLYRNSGDSDNKQMIVKADNDTIHLDSGYPNQASATTWTEKSYSIGNTVTSGNAFTLYLGIKTDGGNYLIDNIKLHEAATTPTNIQSIAEMQIYYANGEIRFSQSADAYIYDMNGKLLLTGNNLDNIDVSSLTHGVYVLRAVFAGQSVVSKIIR